MGEHVYFFVGSPRLPTGQGCISRIYRDTRFSKDKRPYKNFLAIFFWEGGGKKWENPGFYFHLRASKLMLVAGIHIFTRPVLEAYREAVVDPKLGPALGQAVEQVKASGSYVIGEKLYKRVPRGYDPEHQ